MIRNSEDSEATVKQGFLDDYHGQDQSECHSCRTWRLRRNLYRRIAWSALVFIAGFMFFLVVGLVAISSIRNVPSWSQTDFVAVKQELLLTPKKVRFTAGLLYNQEKELYRPMHPGTPQYVGAPTKAIDDAWEELIGAVNIFVTPEEEPTLGGGLYFQPDSKLYMGQPTVTHDLHCLNMIRQNMYPYYEHYPHNNDSIAVPHLEHCIDSLRQSLMCAGDMTVSPIIWSEEKGRIIPNFEVDHTCRDYTALRDWTVQRDSADPDRYPANAERILAQGH